MKRKILFALILSLFACSTAYAAVNGLYKGRPIVKVIVNGQQVKSTVPGQIIDGSTMLPLRAIAEALGARVDWDQATYSAKITTQAPPVEAQEGLSLAELNKIGESVPMVFALDAAGQPFEQGSGFIYNDLHNDLLITNYHVVDESDSLRVHFGGKVETVKTELVISNPDADLAAVRLPGYPSLKLATAEPKKGDKVYVLGHPDQRFTISEGSIQSILWFDIYSEIVSNANTEPGSSGGVMVNESGEVIGIMRGGYGTYSNALHVKHLVDELNKL